MDNENYISPNKITKQYDITSGTLRRWAEAGKIRCLRPNGGKRIYNIEDIKKIFNKQNNDEKPVEKQEEEETGEAQGNQNLQDVLSKLKENIQKEENINSIDYIANEINDLTILINHIKQNKNKQE
jgi:DNA-binding transcriptional MerR regulator